MKAIARQRPWTGRTRTIVCLAAFLFAAACSRSPADSLVPLAAQSRSAVWAGYTSEAKRALGEESHVLLSGDLVHDGHIQLLIVNPLTKMPAGSRIASISRAAILEKDGADWREVFLADDHLKNEKGFLQGAPRGSVSAWRLRYELGKNGLRMFFSPLDQPGGSDSAAVEVGWNPDKRLYQSFDRRTGNFLTEVPTLEGTPSYFIKR